jgi:hypothetical protein
MAVSGEGGAKDDLALHVGQRGHIGESIAQGQAADEIGLEGGRLRIGRVIEIDSET